MVTTNYKANRKPTRKNSNQKANTDIQSIFLNLPFNDAPFIGSNFAEFNLPNETLLVNAFLSEYYFPEEYNYPTPHAHIYAQIAPVNVNIDYITLLWLHSFLLYFLNETKFLSNTLSINKYSNKMYPHTDVHIECQMPRVTLKLFNESASNNTTNPNGIQAVCARVTLSNVYQSKDLHRLCRHMYKTENLCMRVGEWPYEPTGKHRLASC
jgi:hypothetical protein